MDDIADLAQAIAVGDRGVTAHPNEADRRRAEAAIGWLTGSRYRLVPIETIEALGSHDRTGQDHLRDAVEAADQRDLTEGMLRKIFEVSPTVITDPDVIWTDEELAVWQMIGDS